MEGYHWSLGVLITRAEGLGLSPVRGWVTRVGAGPWVQVGDVSVRAFRGPEATASSSPSDQTQGGIFSWFLACRLS